MANISFRSIVKDAMEPAVNLNLLTEAHLIGKKNLSLNFQQELHYGLIKTIELTTTSQNR